MSKTKVSPLTAWLVVLTLHLAFLGMPILAHLAGVKGGSALAWAIYVVWMIVGAIVSFLYAAALFFRLVRKMKITNDLKGKSLAAISTLVIGTSAIFFVFEPGRWIMNTMYPKRYEEISIIDNHNRKYFPLISFLPYETEDWKIWTYTGRLRILVTITERPGLNHNKVKRDVLRWIRSKGVNPSTHEIIWEVITPTPSASE